jgi:hypothetical protein
MLAVAPVSRTAPGRDATHELRPVGERLLGVKGALLAGEALADHLRVFVDQNAHALTFIYWLKVACGPFSGQPTGCFDLRAKGVAFARKHAGWTRWPISRSSPARPLCARHLSDRRPG